MRALRLPFLLPLVLAAPAAAAPLRDAPVEARRADGSTVRLRATGDERVRRVHDDAGFTVIRDPATGEPVYADLRDGRLVPTPLPPGLADPAAAGLHPGLRCAARPPSGPGARPAPPAARGPAAVPVAGTLQNLLVLVRFADDAEYPYRPADFEALFNAPDGTSVSRYFREDSYGAFDVRTTWYPLPQGGAMASVQDPFPRAYYQAYHPQTNPDGYTEDQVAEREHAMVARAIRAIADQVPPDLDVDRDGDGEVDNVTILLTGLPDAWSDLLWPHQWELFEDSASIHGVPVVRYNVQLHDLVFWLGDVGVLVHELSHSIGLPDLYHYEDDPITPVGPWDPMEGQSWQMVPPHHSAYLKHRYAGWLPLLPAARSGVLVARPLGGPDPAAWRVDVPGLSTDFFVVEARRAEGPFEASLPGSGLLVYRIDTLRDGQGNDAGPPDEVYVFRPGGTPASNGQVKLAPLAPDGRTAFGPGTDPAPFLGDGTPVGGLAIHGVEAAGDGLAFRLCLGGAGDCTGRACGDDGCGGTCGGCPAYHGCTLDGRCVRTCTADCLGRFCGDDGCGGTCGTCRHDEACEPAGTVTRCVRHCVPACGARACGDDGCGGTCGTCGGGLVCLAGRCSTAYVAPDAGAPYTPPPASGPAGAAGDAGCAGGRGGSPWALLVLLAAFAIPGRRRAGAAGGAR